MLLSKPMKCSFVLFSCAVFASAMFAAAQAPSPDETTSVTIEGKTLSIKYSAPSVRSRQLFGPGELISHDPNFPVWRAGANAATSFQTNAEQTNRTENVPKGDYTLYALVK